ncbi:MAG: hypothetical protein ABI614_23065, partial [Planctomycetota bacterium]
ESSAASAATASSAWTTVWPARSNQRDLETRQHFGCRMHDPDAADLKESIDLTRNMSAIATGKVKGRGSVRVARR